MKSRFLKYDAVQFLLEIAPLFVILISELFPVTDRDFFDADRLLSFGAQAAHRYRIDVMRIHKTNISAGK